LAANEPIPPSPPGVVVVAAPGELWRIATTDNDLRFAEIDPITAAGPGGNRYDVPGGGVLYASSVVRGCFAETLARYRVDLSSPVAIAAAKDTGFMPPGNLAASWREDRRKFTIGVIDALPFVDIEHEHTRSAMERELPLVLARFDLDHLDVPTVRGADRRLTRALAEWSYTRTDEQGRPLYSGIRYMSKHGNYECWAIFAGTKVELCAAESIEKCDIDLRAVANTFNLTIH
jgi:hypothetical protein